MSARFFLAAFLRYALAALALFAVVPSFADGGPFPATKEQSTGTCTPANHPRGYQSDSNVSGSWVCGGVMGAASSCGWAYTAPAYGWGGNQATGVVSPQCNIPAPTYSCPAGATSSGSGDATVCSCTSGLRPSNGQCVATPACPEGQHEEGGACVPDNCKASEIRVSGVCVPDPDNCPDGKKKGADGKCENACPKAGTFAGEFVVGSIVPTSFCENKCTVSISSFVQAMKDGKVMETVGMGHYTGGQCNGPDYTPPDPDKPNIPGEGDGPGEPGNGGPGTGGTGGTGGGGPSKPQPCPTGGCTGNNGNGPPGTPPDEEGKCPTGFYRSGGACFPNKPPETDPDSDGKCPAGTMKANGRCVAYQPPSDDDRQEAEEFCKKNPDDPSCKRSTFTGACEAGFQCEGDAIACAIANEQYRQNCKLFGEDKDANSLTNKALNGTDDKSADKLRENATQVSVGTFDSSGYGWSHACPSDPSISLNFGGRSSEFSIPFSRICGPLSILSLAGVGITLLGCLVWVLGGKNNRG